MRALGLLAVLFWAVTASVWAVPGIEASLHDLREAAGQSLPLVSEAVSEACASRAQALAAAGVLSHADEAGRGPGLQMVSLGFPQGEYGEVLGSGTPWEAVWKAWLASKPHRDVLMADGWTQWGWASATTGRSTVWVVRFYKP